MVFFIELGLKFLQFVWKHRRSQIAKAILRKKKMKLGKLDSLIAGYITELAKKAHYIRCYRKTQMNFFTNSMQSYSNQDGMVFGT